MHSIPNCVFDASRATALAAIFLLAACSEDPSGHSSVKMASDAGSERSDIEVLMDSTTEMEVALDDEDTVQDEDDMDFTCQTCGPSADDTPAHCGEDWRLTPCMDEPEEICKVDTLAVDGRGRSYVVSRTAGYDCTQGPLPVVIVFHGSGGNGASVRAQVNDTWSDLKLEETFGGRALFVYPDGLPHPDCHCQNCWNRDPTGADVAFFDALLPALESDYCVDRSRVFAVGHSRGGRFVEVLSCYRSDALSGAGMIGTGMGNVTECPGSLPVWLSHGLMDTTVLFTEGLILLDHWKTRNRCDARDDALVPDTCTEVFGCVEPVVWCPTTETDWNGHAIPGLADEGLEAFFLQLK